MFFPGGIIVKTALLEPIFLWLCKQLGIWNARPISFEASSATSAVSHSGKSVAHEERPYTKWVRKSELHLDFMNGVPLPDVIVWAKNPHCAHQSHTKSLPVNMLVIEGIG